MHKVLRMWHQLDYLKRHHQTVTRHLTPRRIANILLNEREMRAQKTVLKSRPPFIKVEPTANCHLHCPGCAWHCENSKAELPAQRLLSFDDFKKLIEPVQDTTVEISFSLRGDALTNRDVFDMAGYCRDHNIGSVVPTNFSYEFGDDVLEQIIHSGLDHIIVAVDGTTQDIYEKYRKGGRLELVLDNSRRLIELKRKRQSKTPLIECKFITFRHNKHQFEDARQLSASLGFDRFSSVLDHFDPRRKADADHEKKIAAKKKSCYWLYRASVICCDGQACACCSDITDLGNALTDGLLGVWNNEGYQSMRRTFATGLVTDKNGEVCMGCCSFGGGLVKSNCSSDAEAPAAV